MKPMPPNIRCWRWQPPRWFLEGQSEQFYPADAGEPG
jgi:hypothetical protein